MKITITHLCALGVLCGSFLAPACQTGPNGGKTLTPIGQIGAHIGTSIVVGKFCDNNPKHALRVAEIAAMIRQSTESGQFSTVDAAMAAVMAEIDWAALEKDGLAEDVRQLLAALGDELKARLAETSLDKINPDTLLTIANIARWIEDSARRSIAIAATP